MRNWAAYDIAIKLGTVTKVLDPSQRRATAFVKLHKRSQAYQAYKDHVRGLRDEYGV